VIRPKEAEHIKKYCLFESPIPNPQSEIYNPGVAREDESMATEQRDMVRVHTVENRFEADLLIQSLRQEHIPAMLRRFEETAYDGLFVTQMGWGAILVPGDYEEEAARVISRVLASITHGVSP
jgi:hypothetical protein